MIISTTPTLEGKKIIEYKGIVFGEVVSGVDFVKDFAAGLTNFFGGRSNSYEGELIHARESALEEMQDRAYQMGANAVMGVDIDYEILGTGNNMMMVIASGTAVIVQD
ncbi:MAG TPA: putative heavy metal-binding protein [Clostridiales bacterium]|nr:putative heavy metal-binding protein [Clostridiales bacterium]